MAVGAITSSEDISQGAEDRQQSSRSPEAALSAEGSVKNSRNQQSQITNLPVLLRIWRSLSYLY